MSSHFDRSRRSLALGVTLVGGLLLPVSVSAQAPTTSPAAPVTSPPAAAPPGSDIVFYPLPSSVIDIGSGIPTVSVDPASSDELEIGQAIDYELGHCGLWSPVDLDGSLWEPDGGVTPAGGPIAEDDDAVIGELINATPGVFVIVDDVTAHWTSVTGTFISFARAPGALDYPLCM